MYLDLLQNQSRTVATLNPSALRHHLEFPVNEESVRMYRKHNRGPMQLWALVFTAPHALLDVDPRDVRSPRLVPLGTLIPGEWRVHHRLPLAACCDKADSGGLGGGGGISSGAGGRCRSAEAR